jgi:hypothetical protein
VARLPVVGSDLNTWGTVLDTYLQTYTTGWLNVRSPDFGAAGDGSTDDTAALAAARDGAGAHGTVLVPPGTYVVSGLALSVAGQRWIIAPGATLLQKAATTSHVFTVSASGVTVTGGGGIDGNFANQTPAAGQSAIVFTTAADHLTLDGVTIQNSNGYGIYGTGSYLTVRNCRFVNTYSTGLLAESDGTADITGITVSGCVVENNNAALTGSGGGFTVQGSGSFRARGVIITGNQISAYPVGASETGFADQTAPVHLHLADGFSITGNSIYAGSLNITLPFCTDGSVTGNFITGWSWYGLELPSCTRVSVTGNTLIDTNPRAATFPSEFCISVSDLAVDLMICGNNIYKVTAAGFAAVNLGNGGAGPYRNLVFADNIIDIDPGATGGGAVANRCSSVTITGNVFDGGGVGTNLVFNDTDDGATDGILISGNTFRNYGAHTGLIYANTVNLDYAIITGNIFDNGGAGQSLDNNGGTLGAHTISTGNVGP